MYNLLIADDEELERKAVKKIIVSAFKDVFNIYEAKNGREAIEIGYNIKPDIFIADIKMPGINGLEAIKELKKSLKDTYLIILTAYDYFAYAKEAIVNDVKGYMLKPLKKDELIEQIKRALAFLEEQKQKRIAEIELKEKVYAILPVLENELIYAIISNNLNSVDYKSYLEYLKLSFKRGYCMVISIDNKKNCEILGQAITSEVKIRIKNNLEEIVKTYHNALLSCMFTKEIVLFIECEPYSDNYSTRLDSISLGRKIAEVIKERIGLQATIGIGKAYDGVEWLSKSYNEALTSQQYNDIEMKVKHYEDVTPNSTLSEKNENKQQDLWLGNESSSTVETKGNYHMDLLPKAKEFIKSNYNKEITLEEIARHVGVSPYYFSKIFKASVGKNYMDYLTALRIEKAKNMMKNGVESIKEICYEVGYNDPNYFSRVFKKIEGLTPSEYKTRSGF